MLDHGEGSWNLNFGLFYWIIKICEISVLAWIELRKVSPNTRGCRNLNRLQWISIHVHV